MKREAWILMGLVLLIGVGQAPGAILYTNGPINGENDGYQISGLGSLTDSFSVSSISIITSAVIGIWERPADLPVQLQWSIGTSQFGSQVSSGISTLSNVLFDSNNVGGNGGWDVYSSTFTLSGKVVPGTQYWLTLQNLIDSNGDPGYWDQNNGPSLAVFANNGTPLAGEQSNSFSLIGSPVPEPSSFVLLSTAGALILCGWLFKRPRNLAANHMA